MDFSLSKFLSGLPDGLSRVFRIRFDKTNIDSVGKLTDFTQTRAAYVAQTSLYGYLKTRIGTRYPHIFKDEAYARSIDIAKWRIFAACLSDLAIFCAATANAKHGLETSDSADLARKCYLLSIENTFDDEEALRIRDEVTAQFEDRLKGLDWTGLEEGENAFIVSPGELIRWAPIAEELKELDEDIVTNSIRFRWRDIRVQLRKRIDGDAIVSDWLTNRNEHSNHVSSEN